MIDHPQFDILKRVILANLTPEYARHYADNLRKENVPLCGRPANNLPYYTDDIDETLVHERWRDLPRNRG